MSAVLRGPVIRGVIFDLDGTLVDSEPLYAESDRAFLAGFGVSLDGLDEGAFVGIGTLAFLAIVAERFPGSPLAALPPEERARLKDEAYLGFSRGRLKPFPAVAGLAREFRRRGLSLAVASGSSPAVIRAELEAIGLGAEPWAPGGPFSAAVSASEVARGKPEPDIFLEAAGRLGLPPSSCLVVEDSRYGVLAAKRAGMACLALPASGEPPEFYLADLIVPGGAAAVEPDSLLAALEGLGLPSSP
jgi:beta-phosphoglucomutase-like phosphatase (HAD superfamily)